MTTPPSYEAQLRKLARVLAEIAHTLEATDHADTRVRRALELLREVVPYRRCGLLEVRDGETECLYLVPEQPDDAHAEVARRMSELFKLVSKGERVGRSRDAVPSLALPLVGLDSTIGVIRVEPDGAAYGATDLRVLSVVAAQLGAYITALRLRERDRQRELRLVAAHDFQQLLAGIVSHDLRNPLAVIIAVANNLLERTTDEKQAEYLRRALRNAQHASRLIADLADVTEARVSGAITLAPAARGFVAFLDTLVNDLRSAHPGATIDVFCEVPVELEVRWDIERMTQVLTNLVSNAIAHGADGLPTRLSAWIEGDAVVLGVHNYGPVIPADLLPSIFDPFKHGPRPRPHTARGLGLGLFIVDQIVRSHGGEVRVESEPLAGTTFTLRVPVRCVHHTADLRAHGGATGQSLVMVIDDDEDVRVALTGILEKRGFGVVCAEDGLEALRLLEGGSRPQLILLDLSMPRMNGEQLCDRLAGDPVLSLIPIVVISADTAAALRINHERARAFVAKPVTIDRLLAAIDTLH